MIASVELRVKNALSIDLEDWFCVYNLSKALPFSKWDQCELRVETSTRQLLDLFDAKQVKATFFVLGWVAEKLPNLVQEIDRKGHEIACHGYSHRLLTQMTPAEFEKDLDTALNLLRRQAKGPVEGFRAPSFTLVSSTMWAVPILARHGIRYDSSVFPVGFHPDYGIPTAPLTPYILQESDVLEFPISCVDLLGSRIPCSGGGYFRLFPYAASRHLMRRCNRERRPLNFYLHPWEVDVKQPRVKLPFAKRFRHYNNLHKTLPRLEKLLGDFNFFPMREALGLCDQKLQSNARIGTRT